MTGPDDLWGVADSALADGRWIEARTAYATLADGTQDARAYEGLAQAAWWLDDAPACLGARETAYRVYRSAGDDVGAARAATALGYDAALFGQGAAVASAWLERARDLLADHPETTAEQGWLDAREAELALLVIHEPTRAAAAARRAYEVGKTTGEPDLELVGQGLIGLSLVALGDVDEGMSRLDAAVVAALVGDVRDLMWVGKICCWLVAACHDVQDYPRAIQWCARVEELCRQRDLGTLWVSCRLQYASVQVAVGNWAEADRLLVSALDRLQLSHRAARMEAVIQLGELRRRQGRLDEADALLAQGDTHPSAIVGRALVRLARGDAAGAWVAMSSALADVTPQDRVQRAAILLPACRCAVAAGATVGARTAATELVAIAQLVGSPAVTAWAATATALTADPPELSRAWREAVRACQAAELPFDESEARLELAGVLADGGDRGGAVDQATAAIGVLTTLQAPARLAAAEAVRARLSERHERGQLTAREVEVLRLVATGKTNAEVARVLVLSEHTVHRHIANILTKLGTPTRAAATAYAISTGLL